MNLDYRGYVGFGHPFQAAIREAPEAEQLDLIRAHPDLAGRARMAEESRKEQAGAGLDHEAGPAPDTAPDLTALPLGDPCSAPTECSSGQCADGVRSSLEVSGIGLRSPTRAPAGTS